MVYINETPPSTYRMRNSDGKKIVRKKVAEIRNKQVVGKIDKIHMKS